MYTFDSRAAIIEALSAGVIFHNGNDETIELSPSPAIGNPSYVATGRDRRGGEYEIASLSSDDALIAHMSIAAWYATDETFHILVALPEYKKREYVRAMQAALIYAHGLLSQARDNYIDACGVIASSDAAYDMAVSEDAAFNAWQASLLAPHDWCGYLIG